MLLHSETVKELIELKASNSKVDFVFDPSLVLKQPANVSKVNFLI